jgi:hypothetical protein
VSVKCRTAMLGNNTAAAAVLSKDIYLTDVYIFNIIKNIYMNFALSEIFMKFFPPFSLRTASNMCTCVCFHKYIQFLYSFESFFFRFLLLVIFIIVVRVKHIFSHSVGAGESVSNGTKPSE